MRKAKRELAKLRKHRRNERVADKWALQRQAVDITELVELLRTALDDFESNNGQLDPEEWPDHWATQARRHLYEKSKLNNPERGQ